MVARIIGTVAVAKMVALLAKNINVLDGITNRFFDFLLFFARFFAVVGRAVILNLLFSAKLGYGVNDDVVQHIDRK